MKRCLLPIITLLCGAALVFAQMEEPQNPALFPPGPGFGPVPRPDPGPGQSRDSLTIQGTLSFVNGQIALKSGETTYYVRGLDRLFGFVDGLKEGAAVTLEGYAGEIPLAPEYRLFLAEKLVFNGREYAGIRPGSPLPKSPGRFPPGPSPGFGPGPGISQADPGMLRGGPGIFQNDSGTFRDSPGAFQNSAGTFR